MIIYKFKTVQNAFWVFLATISIIGCADNGRALVSFDHAGSGLYCPDNTIKHFEIAGADGKYYPAKARIVGKEVMVWSNKVPQPKGVRLGWEHYFEINLFNKEGLPASSFRSMK